MIIPRRGEGSRLETFSDAMLAFACALLVISLGVPRGYADIVTSIRGFIPFGLTFAAILLIWIAHKNLFRRYPLDDAFTVIVNGVFLFTILFYSYPLKWIAGSLVSLVINDSGSPSILSNPEQLRNLFFIYGMGWIVVFFCIALLYIHAARNSEELGLSEIETYDAVSDAMYYLCFVLGGAISVALAYANVGVNDGFPALAYISIGFFAIATTIIRRRYRPDSLEAAIAPSPPRIPEAPHD
jgi:uncharacterized membrane protein